MFNMINRVLLMCCVAFAMPATAAESDEKVELSLSSIIMFALDKDP